MRAGAPPDHGPGNTGAASPLLTASTSPASCSPPDLPRGRHQWNHRRHFALARGCETVSQEFIYSVQLFLYNEYICRKHLALQMAWRGLVFACTLKLKTRVRIPVGTRLNTKVEARVF